MGMWMLLWLCICPQLDGLNVFCAFVRAWNATTSFAIAVNPRPCQQQRQGTDRRQIEKESHPGFELSTGFGKRTTNATLKVGHGIDKSVPRYQHSYSQQAEKEMDAPIGQSPSSAKEIAEGFKEAQSAARVAAAVHCPIIGLQ